MTSYTDKHLAKATEVFGDAYETGNGRDAIQVIAEALADAERDAFKRADQALSLLREAEPRLQYAGDYFYDIGVDLRAEVDWDIAKRIREFASEMEGR